MNRELFDDLKAAAAPVAALVLGVPLLQHHSIEFLTTWKTGASATWDVPMLLAPWKGWGWSLALEIIALWMWYERGAARRAMAVLATAALLFGPIYLTVSNEAGAWDAIQGSAALAALEKPRAEKRVLRLEGELATYLENSRQRSGWLPIIEDTKDRLRAAQEKLAELDRRMLAALGWPWGLIFKAAGWITIILLCGLANVAAITSFSRRFNAPVQTAEPEPVQPKLHSSNAVQVPASELNHPPEPLVPARFIEPSAASPSNEPVQRELIEPVQPDDLTIKRLQKAIAEAIKKSGLSGNKWCADTGVNKRDLHSLSQHFERAANGGTTISKNKLAELIARFLPGNAEVNQ